MKLLQYTGLFFLFLWFCSCSTGKKVVSSQKNIPWWVSDVEKGYIIGEGEGATFGSAKQNALDNIGLKIARTIAQKASTNISIVTTNNNTNNIISSTEIFKKKDMVKTFAPILSGISMLKVEDYYWVQMRTKNGQKIKYYLKYPFSESEIDEEIKKWKKRYKEELLEIKDVLNKPAHYKSVENIMTDLQILDSYINFGDVFVANRINNKKAVLQSLLNRIEIEIVESKEGKVRFCYTLDGNKIAYSLEPRIKISHIGDYSLTKTNDIWTLLYDPKVKNLNADYTVILESEVQGRIITKEIPLKVEDANINVELEGPVLVHQDNNWYSNSKTYFKIKIGTDNNNAFYIIAVQLTPTKYYTSFWTGEHKSQEEETLFVTYSHFLISGKGIHTIEGECDYNLPGWHFLTSVDKVDFQVIIKVAAKETGKKQIFRFNHVKLNTY